MSTRPSSIRVARLVLAVVGAWTLAAATARAGDIQGKVLDRRGDPVADAVIVATPADGRGGGADGAVGTPLVMDQVNKEFVPFVLPLRTGSSVVFPNRDEIRHHVYSFSPARRFELPLYTGTPAAPVTFDKPGVVVLGCNIHDWMVAYIYVTDSPYFAKTGADGIATLGGLAAGEYVVRVWHPRLAGSEEATARRVAVPGSGSVESAFEVALKPEFRIRRAPVPGQGGYR